MTFTEILHGSGLDEAKGKAVLEKMKENRIYLASEENLDIRYAKLKASHEEVTGQRDEANRRLEEMKTSQKEAGELHRQISQLKDQLEETRLNAELRLRLTKAQALDADYLIYRLRENVKRTGGKLELDENGGIRGWDSLLETLRQQSPRLFGSPADAQDGYKVFRPNRLKAGDGMEPVVTKERFAAMSFEERMALKQTNEKRYNELAR